ncbi:hypothetical protein EXT48_14355 [Pseudoalteromonas sp. CO348]|uniref:hypothetical protein n=1 Tax=Pseudoalteromonas TaxID=53246 RepID=UPI001023D654|nr:MULTISPECIES: hypothetical protein [Pseudoalteromonas]MCG7538944.1 hypothetical protein [Pseudoalteromonas sp. OF7H-1]MCG9767335.1 hypothetical protein [Pseudoalteromonas piscicida]RZG03182.1 hypothetical protein EXT48_14355 [Pseudoalteromonas sp. CO348]
MKRFNKVALIPAAVAAVLAGNAYAGTEACFEVYKGADALAVTGFDTIYGGAACIAEASRTGATAANLEATNEAKVAYELTGDLTLDFDAVDGTNTDQHIVYIPTTDIPGGTKITIELSGATFAGNANQIHLVKDADGSGANTNFEAVASSDGTVDGASSITFLTKAGITIGAGTRLAFSRISTGADSTAIDPVGIKIANTTCTTASTTQSVTIKSTSAITDGGNGYNIQGAVSAAQKVVDITPQFYALHGGTTAEVQVNAESSNSEGNAIVARTEFVYNAAANNRLVATSSQAIYKNGFYNRAALLDQAITLDADDHLETAFVATAEPGANVKMRLYNGRTAATGVLDTSVPVQTGTVPGSFGLTQAAATVYNTEAVDLFTPNAGTGDAEPNAQTTAPLLGATYNAMYYVVENNPTDGIMNFNYDATTYYTLDFGTAGELDHCEDNKVTHKVGVNGAVLKVPYVVNAEGNFVRVTNEHDEAAEVTVDVFGESANGNTGARKVTAVELGQVPAKSSVVYFVPKLIEQAVAQKGYTGADGGYAAESLGTNAANAKSADNRHTVTFTVTAPKDSVHGVSVQKIIGGTDRVMPVLDQNEWSQ